MASMVESMHDKGTAEKLRTDLRATFGKDGSNIREIHPDLNYSPDSPE